ncbi:MAG: LamG domain-containing protein [Candidatus Omnitrophica bacterium]|nr:LamG domain-containing protein [Candidatus Omnitrophota bacterium]
MPVLNVAHEFHHRVFYGIPENKPGKIVIGNNASGKAAWNGLIDELRILGANLELSPPADLSWTDPQRKRSLPEGPPLFLPETTPTVSVPCDGTSDIKTSREITAKFAGGQFISGVRGEAYSGGAIELRGKKIITGKEGTIEFWMMPINWNNRMVQNLSFLSGGPAPYFNFYVFNSPGDLRPLSLYFQNDEGKNIFVSASRFIDEENWHHFVLTWQENTYQIYIDGSLAVEQTLRQIEKAIQAEREYLLFSGQRGDKLSAFDEIFIYNRALSPDEAWNAYARYRFPEKVRKATPYTIVYKQYPSKNLVRAEIKFLQGRIPTYLRLDLEQKSKIYSGNLTKVPTSRNEAVVESSTAKIQPGKFNGLLCFLDENKTEFFRTAIALTKKVYPWLGNRLGVPERVPEPWGPLKLQGHRVTCLLTEYNLASPLLTQVITNGQETLASPTVLEAVGSAGKPVIFTLPPPTITLTNNGLGATVTISHHQQGIRLSVSGQMEFDGFIKYRLTVSPETSPVFLNSLRLRIPFQASQALDYYVLGEHMDHVAGEVPGNNGIFWDSLTGKMFKRHELPEYGAMQRPRRGLVYGNFVPFVWLGNNHRGLCFMADNDQGWVQSERKAAVELSREDAVVYLTLNLFAEPITLQTGKSREIVFSLMATPSKKPPRGWRHWKTSSFFVISEAGRVMGNDIFYVPYPVDYQKSAAYMKKLWQQGIVPLPYMDFYGSDGRMEVANDFRWEWWPEITSEQFPARSQIYKTNYCSGSIIDWYLYNFNRWVDECGVNGLYIDNSYPSPMFDALNGPGYLHEKGEVQPGYQLFAMREFYKRIYCLLAEKGKPHPYTMVHMTHCLIAPAMSFADIAYEGEDHYINGESEKGNEKVGADHITYWPNHIVRIIDLPQAWGVGTHWLSAVRGRPELWKLPPSREYYIRAWYTQLLLHDMRGSVSADGGAMAAFDNFLQEDPDGEFVLYRDNNLIKAINAKQIYISYYRRANNLLAVVANHDWKEQTVTLSLNLPESVKVTDGETGQPITLRGKTFSVTIPGRNYRLVLVRVNSGE